MLEQILDYIHNYFVKEVYRGRFRIVNGALVADFLQDGQYFKVLGSVFNDGVHQFSNNDTLKDEEFEGQIWAMAVPPSVVALSAEISAWVLKNGDKANSPFQSESFGGYSYSKVSASTGGKNSVGGGWQNIFGARLNAWRKIS